MCVFNIWGHASQNGHFIAQIGKFKQSPSTDNILHLCVCEYCVCVCVSVTHSHTYTHTLFTFSQLAMWWARKKSCFTNFTNP